MVHNTSHWYAELYSHLSVAVKVRCELLGGLHSAGAARRRRRREVFTSVGAPAATHCRRWCRRHSRLLCFHPPTTPHSDGDS
jgi:hypothetical protein